MNIFTQNPLYRKICVLLGVVLLFFCIDFVRYWERCAYYARVSKLGIDQVALPKPHEKEAIVVLTGDRGRIPRALELLRARKSDLIILSGIATGIPLKDILNEQGDVESNVSETWDKMIKEDRSTSTFENAVESSKLIKKHRITHLLLVTSDYHMVRALATFKVQLPEVTIYPYAVSSELGEWSSGEAISANWKCLWEYIKHFYYSVRLAQSSFTGF